MATLLPTINNHVDKMPLDSLPGLAPAKVTSKKLKGVPPQTITVRQLLNKKELQLQERRLASRSKLPELSEWQTNQYQNTFKHTLCVEMLQNGFHRSFSEIFGLIRQQAEERLRAGPDSNLWNQRPITEEHEKLEKMKFLLVEAESAMLTDNHVYVYQCHHQLAQYFQSTGDKWLADHFYQNCLRISMNVSSDDGRKAAEGHCNVGLSLEEAGNALEAAQNYEDCYRLTKDRLDWLMEDAVTVMHSQSCRHLTRIYTTIAAQCKARGDHDSGLRYLTRAYEMSKEGGDRKLYGDASYQLGMAFIESGKPETALVHLQSYLETCQTLKDSEGIGKACEAIAKAHDSQGHVEESIKYLHKFVSISEESKDDKSLCDACNSLGIRFNCLGKYTAAFENFSRAYNIARTLNDTTRLRLSRVLTGVAHGHQMLDGYAQHVDKCSSRTSITRLLEWKDNRGDEFDKPLTPAPQPREMTDCEPDVETWVSVASGQTQEEITQPEETTDADQQLDEQQQKPDDA